MNTTMLRRLPAVGILLEHPSLRPLLERHSRARVTEAVQAELAALRHAIRQGSEPIVSPEAIALSVHQRLDSDARPRLRRVVNATGVVLNTNLGRAPLAAEAIEHALEIGQAYSTLEYDLAAGKRGSRYSHVEEMLCRLTGAEAAVVVNNNAAAVMLVVAEFGRGREVVVSRGQLVEIGGSFRVPEIIQGAGATLVEVGTTNKTHPHDYEAALGPGTGMILRCHSSNFKMIGFTAEVEAPELAAIVNRHNVSIEQQDVLSVEDLGSGVLVDLTEFGLPYEPTVQESVKAGIDLVTFSGDKLLGGPQMGIVVGRADLIARLKKNPMLRAIRQDKLSLAALEATLRLYLEGRVDRIPTLRMLSLPLETLLERAESLARKLDPLCPAEVVTGVSAVGGGSMPGVELPSWLVAIAPTSAQAMAERLRVGEPPVIARIENDRVLFDVRTLLDGDEDRIATALRGVLT